MKNQYVGDIGDFAKYGLLRTLTGEFPKAEPTLSLGVIWCRNDSEADHPGHGGKTEYLKKPQEFGACDVELFDVLHRLVGRDDRNLAAIEGSGILGAHTKFYGQPLRPPTEVVFFDPDIGLAFNPNQSSGRYLQFPDLDVEPEQTVVIYQSFGRQATHTSQMERWSRVLEKLLPQHAAPQILRFRTISPRAFLIVPSMDHKGLVDYRMEGLLRSLWGEHFALYGDDPSRETMQSLS
ncbi:MAG: hypothetical protein OXD50_12545 [Chloroflexi bacterium]|nr:hypothetical protein [Chloroflexota bacterium]